MQRILRLLLPLAVLLAAIAGLAACGGDGDEATTDTSVDTLLDKTFAGDKKIDSGKLDVSIKVDVGGGGAGVSGPIDISLSGPFESQGEKEIPKFDLEFSASGAGQNIKAGATSTGDKGFVSFNGTDYALSDQMWQQFRQAAEGTQETNEGRSLSDLGLEPRSWITDAENAGEGKVGDTDVIRITGGVDVGKLLDDVNEFLSKAGQFGVPQGDLPTKLTDEQRAQVEEAVKDVKVEIATGKEDTILRRMLIDLSAADPSGGGGSLDMTLDVQLTDLNEGQEFSEPENPKPFEDLLGQLGGLGGLLGGGASGSGSGSGSGAATPENLEEYSQCIENAGQDIEAAQKCADLLAP